MDVVIRKQAINITTSSEKLAFECRQVANASINTDLAKIYEHLAEQIPPSNQYVIIDSLKVDLGTLSIQEFKNHFFELLEDKLVIEFGIQLNSGNSTDILHSREQDSKYEPEGGEGSVTFSTANRQYQDALLFFLRSGTFPWWYQKRDSKTPSEILTDFNKANRIDLLIYLVTRARNSQAKSVKQTVKRLFYHLYESDYETYLIELAELYSGNEIIANVRILIQQKASLVGLFQISTKEFYEQAFSFVLLANDKANFIRMFLTHLSQLFPIKPDHIRAWPSELLNREDFLPPSDKATTLQTPERPTPPKQSSNDVSEQEDGIYISNAGLVILHPFLHPFFKNLSLLDEDNQFISLDAQIRSAVILYYLQSGQEDYKEWEMPLNKILCGMATDELIPNDITLSNQEKAESDLLLKTVIEYWGALKKASIEAVQTTFLIREGKITFKENHWLIQVERTGVDILLDRLPWGIGTIKLPWLKELIYVEW
jgi:hypothetical protein